ncbi:MAG: hypothetical protein PHH85_01900 [Candidatus Methanoperedens sp.]|nr:hypothetical protein [Candidatus Methanoperedens sp.]
MTPSTYHPYCYLEHVKSCQHCKLAPGMEDLCKFKPVRVTDRALTAPKPPVSMKGALPDFWIHRTEKGLTKFRDSSRYLGYYDPDSVMDAIDEGIRVAPWEYRAYMEDPFTPRRIYMGDDARIKESELDNYKDGGYMPDDDGTPALVTPFDAGMGGDEEDMPSPENANMWHDGGFVPAFIFRSTHRDRKILVVPDGKDKPFYRWETVPTLKPVGCKVELKDGYVVPLGKHVRMSTIKTRADHKRSKDRAELGRQKRAYYGYLIKRDAATTKAGHPLPCLPGTPVRARGSGLQFQREAPRVVPAVGSASQDRIRKLQEVASATS